uniref:Integrase core domain containing protein n=1 Tax=Solanum tuberosum TaxID=4113 RepID=M1DNJ8_SOLTU
MGSLARPADVRATRVEMDIPKLIDQAIQEHLAHLTKLVVKCEWDIESHTLRLDDLSTRIEAQEKAKGSFGALETMRAEIAALRAEVVQLQPTDISMLWGKFPLPDVLVYEPEVDVHNEIVAEDKSERTEEELVEETLTEL